MSRPPLPLTALRTFEVAARLLSFKDAAAELHVTPTAVSHQIQLLERSMGVELFVRGHRKLSLTPAATACLPHIQNGFTSLRSAVEVMQQHRDTGLLSVSAPPSFATRLLMPLTLEFLAAHPDIDLRITTRMREPANIAKPQDETATFQQWAEESDVVIVFGRNGFGDLQVERLLPLSVELVCSPELVAAGGLQEPDDVAKFPWIHDDRGLKYGGSSFWAQWLAQAGVGLDDHGRGPHYTHASVAIDAAARGHGLLVTTACLCQKELTEGLLVSPFRQRVPISNSYFLLHRRTQRAAVDRFREWLKSAMPATKLPAVR